MDGPLFSPDGRRILTASTDGTARLWPVLQSTQALVDHGKTIAPRCLSQLTRKESFLPPEPLAWCIEMKKWPYQTQDWNDWLAKKGTDANLPLPDTAE